MKNNETLQLKMLEQELEQIQENINRLKIHINETNYTTYSSNVFGELKHRLIALKQRITLVNKLTTWNLFNEKYK